MIGISTTYPQEELSAAEFIIPSLGYRPSAPLACSSIIHPGPQPQTVVWTLIPLGTKDRSGQPVLKQPGYFRSVVLVFFLPSTIHE